MSLMTAEVEFLDRLKVGVSVVTWLPDKPDEIDWVYVNEARARMVGLSREEVMAVRPFRQLTRETRAAVDTINHQIARTGRYETRSTLLHRTHRPIPVNMIMTRLDRETGPLLMTEFQDISAFKDTEAQLLRAQDRARNIMQLVSDEKRQIAENIRGNIALVALPLIDQLRTQATDEQRESLDVLEKRIRHVTRRLGIAPDSGLPGAALTRREMLICEMIRDGLTSKAIASALDCSPSTVNNHRNAIRRKLGLSGRSVNLEAHLNQAARDAAGSDHLDATELDGLI